MVRVEALLAIVLLLVACAPSQPDYYGANIDLSGASRPIPASLVEKLVPPEQHGYPDAPIRRHRPSQKLPPEFGSVSADTAAVLACPRERVRIAQEVVSSFESRRTDPARHARAVNRMDAAVQEVLEALGLPRRPDVSVSVDFLQYTGVYYPDDHRIILGYEHMVLQMAPRTSRFPVDQDQPYGTWIHESLHARASSVVPKTPGESARLDPSPYEEELVEVLTAGVCRRSGLDCGSSADRSWKGMWRVAATELGLDEVVLVHGLARYGVYQVRAGLPSVVEHLYLEIHGREVAVDRLARALTRIDEMARSPLRESPVR